MMLFVALAVASLGVLPAYAIDIKFSKSFGVCSPEIDGVKRCDPNGHAPNKFICNGEKRLWQASNEPCTTPADGDWHIGCAVSDHCDFYQDHPSQNGALHPRADPKSYQDHLSQGPPPADPKAKPADWVGIPDGDAVDTRCSLTALDLVEKFDKQGKEWVHHYKCPAGTTCLDLHGHGACKAGLREYTVPGLNYLWVFTCANGLDWSACRFADSMYKQKVPTPLEPYLIEATRCKPNHRVVQYHDGKSDSWKDIYACKAEATCVQSGARAGCQAGQYLAYPMQSLSHVDEPAIAHQDTPQPDDVPPTRCNPLIKDQAQFFSGFWNKWVDFHTCELSEGCFNSQGRAHCDDKTQILRPYVELLNGLERWHPIMSPLSRTPPVVHVFGDGDEEDEKYQALLDLLQQKVELDEDEDVDMLLPVPQKAVTQITRCDPDDIEGKVVQYLHPRGQWLRFYTCRGHCQLFQEYAACEEYRNKYLIPRPPTLQQRQSVSRRALSSPGALANEGRGSKCDAFTASGVKSLVHGITVAFGNCPGDTPCREVQGMAVCDVDGRPYAMDYHVALPPRQDPHNPLAPDFHTFDTRCNPQYLSEIQRHNGSHWVHHFTCTFPGSCVDVDGHGACRLRDNVYELPSANWSSVHKGEAINPLRVETKCSKSNASEVLEWNGKSWKTRGVCLPPYNCYDFNGAADFALCAHPHTKQSEVWMPWPSLGRGINNGLVTRCKDKATLERFTDDVWVPFRTCRGVFTCRDVQDGPQNGGCVAPSLYDIMHRPGSVDGSIGDFNRLPKREEPQEGLLKNSESVTEQGEMLINQGKSLIAQGDSLLKNFFGPRDGGSMGEFAAMYGDEVYYSDASPTRLVDPSGPNTSLIPTVYPTGSTTHRRNIGGILDDSFDMHKHGQTLVEEGNRLVDQGKQLLKTIFGDRTDEYIRYITGDRGGPVLTGLDITLPEVPDLPDPSEWEDDAKDAAEKVKDIFDDTIRGPHAHTEDSASDTE